MNIENCRYKNKLGDNYKGYSSDHDNKERFLEILSKIKVKLEEIFSYILTPLPQYKQPIFSNQKQIFKIILLVVREILTISPEGKNCFKTRSCRISLRTRCCHILKYSLRKCIFDQLNLSCLKQKFYLIILILLGRTPFSIFSLYTRFYGLKLQILQYTHMILQFTLVVLHLYLVN